MLRGINLSLLHFNKLLSRSLSAKAKVPSESTWNKYEEKDLPPETSIDKNTIELLERLSLVDFNNKAGIERLSKAVRFADHLHLVNTEGVEPMDSVLEDRSLYLRSDEINQQNSREDIMRNASKTEEEYFVAPPGNIPLKVEEKHYLKKSEDT